MKLVIFKGCHYSTFFPRIICKNNFNKTIKVRFDESCKYVINESSCVNKLWGFSSGLFGVHENSYRFGWTYDSITNRIVIWTYMYINGRLYKDILHYCKLEVDYTFNIESHTSESGITHTTFSIYDNDTLLINKTFHCPYALKNTLLELGFYFGGNTRAPHKMFINFKRCNNKSILT
jgi:hypothetical protein